MLHYAVSDAKGIAETFEKTMGGKAKSAGAAPAASSMRVKEYLNEQASRDNLTDALFYQLPAEVRPEDTVIIFFSGHGAPDTVTDAQGNVETLLLPIDADPSKLFTTAIRMSDVGTMLRRMRSERIVFLADTCYCGAAAKRFHARRDCRTDRPINSAASTSVSSFRFTRPKASKRFRSFADIRSSSIRPAYTGNGGDTSISAKG